MKNKSPAGYFVAVLFFLSLICGQAFAGSDFQNFGNIVLNVRVNDRVGKMFLVPDEQVSISYDYTIWGDNNAIIFSVLFFVDPSNQVQVLNVIPHGTGNRFPGTRWSATVTANLPRGVNFFYLYTAPAYNENDAVADVRQGIQAASGYLKHYGCAFTVERR